MGLFWEEFKIGDIYITEEILLTFDIVKKFAELSGDNNPIHTNNKDAHNSIYKGIVAHGMLIVSLFTGLNRRLGILKGTSMGVVHIEWDFKRPVYVNDTIYFSIEIIEKRETSKMDRGILKRHVSTYRQDGTEVCKGVFVNFVKRGEL